jgi:hypothetical protein
MKCADRLRDYVYDLAGGALMPVCAYFLDARLYILDHVLRRNTIARSPYDDPRVLIDTCVQVRGVS